MKQLSKIIVYLACAFKPIILKILPIGFLRKVKRLIIANSIDHLADMQIKPYQYGYYPHGINLIGDITAETGLGQSCRIIASILEQIKMPISIYFYNQLGTQFHANSVLGNKVSKEALYDVNLIHINPHELGMAYLQLEQSVWDYRYNIAYWLWELEEFPEEWTPFFEQLDEIWAPSEFICQAIRNKTKLPVRCMPYYVDVTIENEFSRRDFGIPENKFLYLVMYDHNSCMERKNPIGVIKAFQRAFSKENSNVGLVIKINNAVKDDEKKINEILSDYQNVYVIKEVLSRDAVNSLIKCVDVVVSLHRAEGFGLVLAEAMMLGTPTIATNWSSNTEFMNKDVACMVDYKLVTLEHDMLPFKKGNRWAEPDIDQAAFYMKKLYDDKKFYNNMVKSAKKHVAQTLNIHEAKSRIQKRLEEIYKSKVIG